MNEELPAGIVSLEDDAPPQPPSPAPVVQPEVPAVPADQEPADVDAVEVAGKKYVPVGAVIQERQKRQAAEQTAKDVDALRQWRAQAEPYVQFLQSHPELFQRQQHPAPDPVPSPQADPDAMEAARLMDFYKADGSGLDAEKGAQWLALQDRRSRRVASETMQPMQQHTVKGQSDANFQRALQIKDADGRAPSVESLQAVWASMPPEYTADPRVAGVLAATAHGFDRIRTKTTPIIAPPPNAPLETEVAGGQPRPVQRMSGLEHRIAADRRVAPDKWQALTKGFVSGRPNVMEDE